MVFKKYDEQQTYQVPVTGAAGLGLKVGDLFSYNPASHEIGSKITRKSEALELITEGVRELFMVAQGYDVTYKTGTAYKTYKISDNAGNEDDDIDELIIVAYRVTMLDNVSGWEDEQ